jgi:hypothetical protein
MNTERPHKGLDRAVPQSRYRASPVTFAATLALPDYYAADLVRRVHADGAASLNGVPPDSLIVGRHLTRHS